jgi:hypothetical protein
MLLLGTVSVRSAPPEPLLVTPSDSGPKFLALRESELNAMWPSDGQISAEDQAIEDFGRAISEAAQLQQQLIKANCKSTRTVPADGPGRFAWEANCRYQRR